MAGLAILAALGILARRGPAEIGRAMETDGYEYRDAPVDARLVHALNALPVFAPPTTSASRTLPTLVAELDAMLAFLDGSFTRDQWVQLTSFGPSGLVISHALERRRSRQPYHVVTVDTLHLFNESAAFARAWTDARRGVAVVHAYAPRGVALNTTDGGGVSRMAFADLFGAALWEREPDLYGYLTKAEPLARAAHDLPNVRVLITGRRSTQGFARAKLQPWELYSVAHFEGANETYRPTGASRSLLKFQPLCWWSETDVWEYIKTYGVAYNPLYDEGYRSLGDVHSTQKGSSGGSERAGRFVSEPTAPTSTPDAHTPSADRECGMHTKIIEGTTAGGAAERMEWRRHVVIEEAARGGLSSIAGFGFSTWGEPAAGSPPPTTAAAPPPSSTEFR